MKDHILGNLIYPFIAIPHLLTQLLGFLIAIVPAAIALCSKGPKHFKRYSNIFKFCEGLPFGKTVFSSLIGFAAPYSASISGHVEEFTDYSVTVSIMDRPWLRNPFSSIHAIALANLGELCSGLATMSMLQTLKGVKGIPIRVDCSYKKKARGKITSKCSFKEQTLEQLKKLDDTMELKVDTEMRDTHGDLVATCTVTWTFKRKKA
mmetsp:Transcript_29531/g.41177  ORF Transcript_29531/g.41177 Transcript_29531/m.41177 type:complete len:206 (-) Transcript_29531:82-699(-)